MAPIITTARLVCKDKEAREKAIAAFHKIVEFSRANEPGVLRYIVTLPLSDDAQKEIYMIEEYASAEASASHLATEPVQELIKLFGSGEVLAAAPEVFNSSVKHAKVGPKPINVSANLAVVIAHFGYEAGKVSDALGGWKSLVEYVVASESGTSGYAVGVDENGKDLTVVAVYDSWDYFDNVHLKSKGTKESRAQTREGRTGVQDVVRLRVVDGFMGKQAGGSKL
ncbi:hypothetical protein BU24DRAFT_372042 [Aaosphaeria arxii CBS 175.79]|uniref:ABM domain-containing protein n=1 Tax=Aaosphaeria arxii CBS 175.79 TaxID=1450172 RepID=A0A6A5XQM4_9PLEO|nr:uncharacterized protein BU24DRAFT_372042 [Aaosphaeria arxii CBS 175.79]KAF2015137.1 hypothetical protein BU24DRAFT_372042 [Aaosphaeria arxii CBS 175.79]